MSMDCAAGAVTVSVTESPFMTCHSLLVVTGTASIMGSIDLLAAFGLSFAMTGAFLLTGAQPGASAIRAAAKTDPSKKLNSVFTVLLDMLSINVSCVFVPMLSTRFVGLLLWLSSPACLHDSLLCRARRPRRAKRQSNRCSAACRRETRTHGSSHCVRGGLQSCLRLSCAPTRSSKMSAPLHSCTDSRCRMRDRSNAAGYRSAPHFGLLDVADAGTARA